jgi:hypothetical protein
MASHTHTKFHESLFGGSKDICRSSVLKANNALKYFSPTANNSSGCHSNVS